MTCFAARPFLFCADNHDPMKLNLTISGKIVASTPVAPFLATDNNYLKALRRLLVLRHGKALKSVSTVPNFFLEHPIAKTGSSSRLN